VNKKATKKLVKRFQELAMKEAFGETSTAEHQKLEMIQALLRPKRSREEIVREAESSFETRRLFKLFGKIKREAEEELRLFKCV